MFEYSNESIDRIEKIKKLKAAWVITYANNFHGKMDISEITSPLAPLLQGEGKLEDFPQVKEEHKQWLYTACTRSAKKLVLVHS